MQWSGGSNLVKKRKKNTTRETAFEKEILCECVHLIHLCICIWDFQSFFFFHIEHEWKVQFRRFNFLFSFVKIPVLSVQFNCSKNNKYFYHFHEMVRAMERMHVALKMVLGSFVFVLNGWPKYLTRSWLGFNPWFLNTNLYFYLYAVFIFCFFFFSLYCQDNRVSSFFSCLCVCACVCV